MNGTMLLGLVRHILGGVGMWMASKGYMTSEAVDAAMGAILTLGAVGWSVADKMLNPPAINPPAMPRPEGPAARANPNPNPSPSSSLGMLGLGLVLVLAAALGAPALADTIRNPAPAYPRSADAQDWMKKREALAEASLLDGSWYLGLLGQHAWSDDLENGWAAGVVGGYLLRFGAIGAGVELDATRLVDNVPYFDELDHWTFTARPRLGVFVVEKVFAYGTAGLAWQGGDSSLVWGGGLELHPTDKTFIRAEVLKFEQASLDPTVVRAAVGFRF